MPFTATQYYQLLSFISWISSNFLKVFIFFASPAKGCHSILDNSSKQPHWSSKTAHPFDSPYNLQLAVAGSPREGCRRQATAFYGMFKFHLFSWVKQHCLGFYLLLGSCKNTVPGQIICYCTVPGCSRQQVG